MITAWDAVGVASLYDHERVVKKVQKPERAHAWDEEEWARGGRQPVTADALRAGRGYNPWREADEKNGRQSNREQALTAEQIMSAGVVTVTADTTVAEAWDEFIRHKYRHMPVLHPDSGSLIGILSERDVLRAAGTPDHTPSADLRSQAIAGIMTTPVYSARPTTTIRDIAKVLFAEHIGAMVITDEDQSLVGIVTRSDILRVLVNTAPLHLWV